MKHSIDTMIAKLEKLTLPRIQKETEVIILSDPELLRRKKAELKTGVNPLGGIIGTYRSKGYELFKSQKNPLAGGNVDLILKGAFSNSAFVVSKGGGKYSIDYRDSKADDLISKYGGDGNLNTINPMVFAGLQKTKYAPQLNERLKRIARL